MTEIVDRSGNIFRSKCEAVVVTVNCEGVMGAGIALDAKLRWPGVFENYSNACETGVLTIGRNHMIPRSLGFADRDVICFPTKNRWRLPSRIQYIRSGLADLRERIKEWEVGSIALPHLGCSHGGLRWKDVRPLVVAALGDLQGLDVELWDFAEEVDDPDFARLRQLLKATDPKLAAKRLDATTRQVGALIAALSLPSVRGLASLQTAPGIGEGTLKAVYQYLFHEGVEPEQRGLFDDP